MNDCTLYVGLDYHQSSVQVCAMDVSGKVLWFDATKRVEWNTCCGRGVDQGGQPAIACDVDRSRTAFDSDGYDLESAGAQAVGQRKTEVCGDCCGGQPLGSLALPSDAAEPVGCMIAVLTLGAARGMGIRSMWIKGTKIRDTEISDMEIRDMESRRMNQDIQKEPTTASC